MALQLIDLGEVDNPLTGDTLHDGGTKINSMMTELYGRDYAAHPPNDGNGYVLKDGVWVQEAPFPEAPIDGAQYARQDGAWSAVAAGGGGILYHFMVRIPSYGASSRRYVAGVDGLWSTGSWANYQNSALYINLAQNGVLAVKGNSNIKSLWMNNGVSSNLTTDHLLQVLLMEPPPNYTGSSPQYISIVNDYPISSAIPYKWQQIPLESMNRTDIPANWLIGFTLRRYSSSSMWNGEILLELEDA